MQLHWLKLGREGVPGVKDASFNDNHPRSIFDCRLFVKRVIMDYEEFTDVLNVCDQVHLHGCAWCMQQGIQRGLKARDFLSREAGETIELKTHSQQEVLGRCAQRLREKINDNIHMSNEYDRFKVERGSLGWCALSIIGLGCRSGGPELMHCAKAAVHGHILPVLRGKRIPDNVQKASHAEKAAAKTRKALKRKEPPSRSAGQRQNKSEEIKVDISSMTFTERQRHLQLTAQRTPPEDQDNDNPDPEEKKHQQLLSVRTLSVLTQYLLSTDTVLTQY